MMPASYVGRHRQVRMLPVAEHAEALELLALDAEVLLGVGAAAAADLELRHARAPCRRGRAGPDARSACRGSPSPARTASGGRPSAVDLTIDVLDDLVERRCRGGRCRWRTAARRAAGSARSPALRAAAALVEALRLPARQDLRLARRQIAAHREVGLAADSACACSPWSLGVGRGSRLSRAEPPPVQRQLRPRSARHSSPLAQFNSAVALARSVAFASSERSRQSRADANGQADGQQLLPGRISELREDRRGRRRRSPASTACPG